MDEPSRIERLSQLDLSNLRIEDHGLPMHVAALMFLGQAGPSGELDLDTFRVAVARRLQRVPRLRRLYGSMIPVLISGNTCGCAWSPHRETSQRCWRCARS